MSGDYLDVSDDDDDTASRLKAAEDGIAECDKELVGIKGQLFSAKVKLQNAEKKQEEALQALAQEKTRTAEFDRALKTAKAGRCTHTFPCC